MRLNRKLTLDLSADAEETIDLSGLARGDLAIDVQLVGDGGDAAGTLVIATSCDDGAHWNPEALYDPVAGSVAASLAVAAGLIGGNASELVRLLHLGAPLLGFIYTRAGGTGSLSANVVAR
jgi:hypothetical protein